MSRRKASGYASGEDARPRGGPTRWLAKLLLPHESAQMSPLRPLSLLVVCLAVLELGGAADGAVARANGLIAYVRADSAPSWIWVVRPDGGGRHALVQGRQPAWSPDGSRLAFVRPSESLESGIYVMNADGSGLRLIAPRVATNPAWSPDSTRIVFSDGRDVYSIGADGSRAEQLTADPGTTQHRRGRPRELASPSSVTAHCG